LEIEMRKFLAFILIALCGYAFADIESDATTQGVDAWISKNLTAAKLASTVRGYEIVTAANTILDTECGTTFFLNSATEFASTLPAPAEGCYFKFVVIAAPSGASYTVATNGGSDVLIGGVNELEVDTGDDGPYQADADTITFADGVSVVGDYVEMVSDGTSWYFTGQTNADGGVTLSSS
jgi:hypothetical protein